MRETHMIVQSDLSKLCILQFSFIHVIRVDVLMYKLKMLLGDVVMHQSTPWSPTPPYILL